MQERGIHKGKSVRVLMIVGMFPVRHSTRNELEKSGSNARGDGDIVGNLAAEYLLVSSTVQVGKDD